MSYALGGKIVTVACPTDVFVFDNNGVLVASVEDNFVTRSSPDILVYTADAVKLFAVPLDYDCTIKVNATDNGQMTYCVSEYDEDINNVQTIVYQDVDISKGSTFTGTVTKSLNETPSSYNLTNNKNGEVVDNYKVLSNGTYVPVTDIDCLNAQENMQVGESRQLNIVVYPENASITSVIWSSSNSEIVDVSEIGIITAKAEGAAVITAHSLYDGVSMVYPLVVSASSNTSGTNNTGTLPDTEVEDYSVIHIVVLFVMTVLTIFAFAVKRRYDRK